MADRLPPIPTIEEAEAEVLAEWEAERQQALRFFANERIKRVQDFHRQAEREERNERKRQAEADEAAKLARKAWIKVFGRAIAGQLEPWAEYTLLPWETKHMAVRSENVEPTRSAAVLAGIDTHTGTEHTGVRGIHITRHASELAGVDPTPDQIAAVGERKRQAEHQDQEARRRRDEREKQQHREKQLLGVTVSD